MNFFHLLVLISIFLSVSIVSSQQTVRCPPGGKPRVRREWRSLTPRIRRRVVTAVWIMRNLTTAEGQARYGPNFISYEDLVLQHSCTALDPRCDQAHFNPVFFVFHRAFLLKYENSLLAIDPSVEAMPYWNVAFDSINGRYRHHPRKHIFSNDFFGAQRGREGDNFALLDGVFARFPVIKYDPSRHGPDSNSPFQCIREGWIRPKPATVCQRCCGRPDCVCDRPDDVFELFVRGELATGNCSPYTFRDYEQFPEAEGTRDLTYTEQDFMKCTNGTLIRSVDQWQRCIELERSACLFGNVDVSKIPGDVQVKLRTLAYLATENKTCALNGYYFDDTGSRVEVNAHHSQMHYKIAGDFRDGATSPNDPIFFSLHADVDRNSMTWQVNTQYLERDYWGFPKDQSVPPNARAAFSGPFAIYHVMGCSLFNSHSHPNYEAYTKNPWNPGTLLDDVMNSGYPLNNIFGEECETAPYTARDVIERTTPSTTPYTYDTLEHLYDNCVTPEMPVCETKSN